MNRYVSGVSPRTLYGVSCQKCSALVGQVEGLRFAQAPAALMPAGGMSPTTAAASATYRVLQTVE